MEKKQRIEQFLKELQLLSKNKNIDPDQIYEKIITYEIPEEEAKESLEEVFQQQINANQNNKYMNVFINEKMKGFCHFISKNNEITGDCIKLYVPLKKENINNSVSNIFTFINLKKIIHSSKLAKNVRIDDLVIRVLTTEEALKVVNTINKIVGSSLYEPSPFAINFDKIGMAFDRNLSYNDILSRFINLYIKNINNNGEIASYDTFLEFMNKELLKMKNKENLSEIINITEYIDEYSKRLINIEEVLKVIIMNLEGAQPSDLFYFYSQINREDYLKDKFEEYKDFDNMSENKLLLEEIISTMLIKYGKELTKSYLKSYKISNNVEGITRTNNLRNKVANSDSFITYIHMVDIDNLIDKAAINLKCDEVSKDSLTKDAILENVCKETYKAFQNEERNYLGKFQVAGALVRMTYGDYSCITSTNNARKIAKNKIKPEEVVNIIKSTLELNGYILEDEEDLYETYAEHIENLCEEHKRGRKK